MRTRSSQSTAKVACTRSGAADASCCAASGRHRKTKPSEACAQTCRRRNCSWRACGSQATSAWQAFVAPAGTQAAIVQKLNKALVDVVKSPETQKRFHDLGLRPLTSTPDELGAYLKSELVRWGKVVEAAGAKGIQ